MLSFQKVEFFHRYYESFSQTEGSWVIYWTNFGCISSSSQWMIPGSWSGED